MDISSKACSLTATGFFFLPSICIAPFNSSRYGAASAFRRGPSFCTTDTGLHCITCTILNFSGYFYFLSSLVELFQFPNFATMLYPNKAKKSTGRAGISASAPYNFLHFSQQYTVHILAWCGKKSSCILSCACVRITESPFPRQICAYIIWSRGANNCGGSVGSWRFESTLGISCLG